jgi:3-hydroxyisobutyrate dehydrogenase-like beta-hydroxyacid dehydrogenase
MESNTLPTVGFIGLGDQGLPIAVAIAEAGYPLQAWARRPGSLDALAGVAHVRHDHLGDLAAASDIVCLCVSTDKDVMGLLTGGLLAGLRPGSIVVNHGTGTPRQAMLFAETCATAGVEFLDAPVSGGRVGAEARTLTTMVGGPERVAQGCEALFRSFSAHVARLGGHGAGELAKLFNNALMMMNHANNADILELATRLNVDPVALVSVLRAASGSSTALDLMAANSAGVPQEAIAHIRDVLLLDMELFDTAMTESDAHADAITARGVLGANRVPEIIRILNP